MTIRYLAHSKNDNGNGVEEDLRVHLEAVAARAADFAERFGAREQAYAAGLLHDLGKYAEQFLRRLRDPCEPSRDHWSIGALAAAMCYKRLGLFPALAILGHHVGLAELKSHERLGKELTTALDNDRRADDPRKLLTETDTAAVQARFQTDGLTWPRIAQGLVPHEDGETAADMLDVRMLFSALVDADFLETEAHFNGDATVPRRPRPDGPALELDAALAAFQTYMARYATADSQSPMNAMRQQLQQQCIAAACQRTGIFTLSAPTGAGKTLAMLAFALHHAKHNNNLRRIVLVMPYLNIIEQTAKIYGDVFPSGAGSGNPSVAQFDPNFILEHHSLADDVPEGADQDSVSEKHRLRRLLAENWDAPIILTTSVQFLESLHAHRPGRCRKLHRLARSVILFDEVQTLPPRLAVLTLATLSRLADPDGPYRSTVVFATATQPAFESVHSRVEQLTSTGWQPAEIVTNAGPMFALAAGRLRVRWRHESPLLLSALADELAQRQCRRVLCIVNLKRHALELATVLRDRGVKGLFHLSTNMCPAHRTAVLDAIRQRLDESSSPVRLIATQCVEAGVDLDFPIVYRALAPLEAIAQAAGRCNRHGKLDVGKLIVFKPLEDDSDRRSRALYPPGYGEAADTTELFLKNLAADGHDLDATNILNDPGRIRDYYRSFYRLCGRDSKHTIRNDEDELDEALRAADFQRVACAYKLIDDNTINVLVPYQPEALKGLRRALEEPERLTPQIIRDWVRRARPHAVGLFRPAPDSSDWNHLEPVQFSRRERAEKSEAKWFWPLDGVTYDDFGLSFAENSWLA